MLTSREWRWLASVGEDLRYAVRSLRRSPGFTAIVTLTLALGVGASTAVYTVVDAVLLQPLSFPESDRLVRVAENLPWMAADGVPVQGGVTYREFQDWRSRSTTLEGMVGIASALGLVRTAGGTAR